MTKQNKVIGSVNIRTRTQTYIHTTHALLTLVNDPS